MVQGRIAGTKIVQGHLDTQTLNLTENLLHTIHVIDRQTLCHFQRQIPRINSRLLQNIADFLHDIVLQQLHNRQIDIHLVIGMSHIIPVFAAFCSFSEHILSDWIDQSQILRQRNKIPRTDKSHYTGIPANQRLRTAARHSLCGHIDDRLIVHFEFTAGIHGCRAHIFLQIQPLMRRLFILVIEILDPVLPMMLSRKKCHICLADQILHGIAVGREADNSHTHGTVIVLSL